RRGPRGARWGTFWPPAPMISSRPSPDAGRTSRGEARSACHGNSSKHSGVDRETRIGQGTHQQPRRNQSMADITKITPNTLINAERVEGTSVYNPQGDKLGTIDDIMIDKVSGKAIYALMSFGGFLRSGEEYHPAS